MDLDLDDHSIPAFLILHDGTVFQGYGFGASNQEAFGEVVFNTSVPDVLTFAADPVIPIPTLPANAGAA